MDYIKKIKENSVIRDVQEVISFYNLSIWRNNSGASKLENGRYIRYGAKGTSDFIGYDKKGRFVAIECKRPKGGRLTKEQTEFLESVKNAGGVAMVVISGAETIENLKKEGVI